MFETKRRERERKRERGGVRYIERDTQLDRHRDSETERRRTPRCVTAQPRRVKVLAVQKRAEAGAWRGAP